MIRSHCALVVLAVLVSAVPAEAQIPRIITEQAAQQNGLHRAWVSQVEFDPSFSRVQGLLLDVVDPPDPAGLRRDTLFVHSRSGLIHAMDAETGGTLWVAQVGNRKYPNLGPAVNDRFVAVINGTMLYLLDRADGTIIWERSMARVPSAAPVLTPDLLMVPALSGQISSYRLPIWRENEGWEFAIREENIYQSFGVINIPPIVSGESLAWATSRGFLYISTPDNANVRFRLQTRDEITAPLGYWSPAVMVASRDGYVYAINEISGNTLWRYGVGSAINQPPLCIDGKCYIVPEDGGMYCLKALTGEEWWPGPAPNIEQLVAASTTKVYATDGYAHLLSLDIRTGGMLSSLPIPGFKHLLTNTHTDRIYMASESGLVICLHERDLAKPLVHPRPGPIGSPAAGEEAAEDAADEAVEVPSEEEEDEF